jgi:hypothetical protein
MSSNIAIELPAAHLPLTLEAGFALWRVPDFPLI